MVIFLIFFHTLIWPENEALNSRDFAEKQPVSSGQLIIQTSRGSALKLFSTPGK